MVHIAIPPTNKGSKSRSSSFARARRNSEGYVEQLENSLTECVSELAGLLNTSQKLKSLIADQDEAIGRLEARVTAFSHMTYTRPAISVPESPDTPMSCLTPSSASSCDRSMSRQSLLGAPASSMEPPMGSDQVPIPLPRTPSRRTTSSPDKFYDLLHSSSGDVDFCDDITSSERRRSNYTDGRESTRAATAPWEPLKPASTVESDEPVLSQPLSSREASFSCLQFDQLSLQVEAGLLGKVPGLPSWCNDIVAVFCVTESTRNWYLVKSYAQLRALDESLRVWCVEPGAELLALPEKSLFNSSSPATVSARIAMLNSYFARLVELIAMPASQPGLTTAGIDVFGEFIRTDLANRPRNGDMEGYLLRKAKFGGYKLRYYMLCGHALFVFDKLDSTPVDTYDLLLAQISQGNTARNSEDHHFVIKLLNGKQLSLCAESEAHKSEWIETVRALPLERQPSDLFGQPRPFVLAQTTLQLAYGMQTLRRESVISHQDKDAVVNRSNKVFGAPLSVALDHCSLILEERVLPAVVVRCLQHLAHQSNLKEEGLFRVPGSQTQVLKISEIFEQQGDFDLIAAGTGTHVTASLLKLYLRQLPEPLLRPGNETQFQECLFMDQNKRNQSLRRLLLTLEPATYDLIYTVMRFLSQVVDCQALNKMNVRNICIVFSPTLNVTADVLTVWIEDFDSVFS